MYRIFFCVLIAREMQVGRLSQLQPNQHDNSMQYVGTGDAFMWHLFHNHLMFDVLVS